MANVTKPRKTKATDAWRKRKHVQRGSVAIASLYLPTRYEEDIQVMEVLDEPYSDEMLCSAVYAENLSGIQEAIEELQEADSPMKLSRAMVACILTRNIPALILLFNYGEAEEEVAEAAAASESTELVRIILNHGWHINRALRGGSIPSILSLAIRNAAFVRDLLSLGADPNQDSNLGETALSFAIREGTMKVIKTLLAAGADVTKGDLLHCVSRREESEDTRDLVALLIQMGVAVDTYQWDNERAKMMRYGYPQGTALHVACAQQNYTAAAALLEFGADPWRLKKKGELMVPPSPYDIMTSAPVGKLLEIVQESVSSVMSPDFIGK